MKSRIVMRPLLLVSLWVSTLHAELRTFTSTSGTTLKGELVSVVGDIVTIKKEDGTPLTLKISAFSRVDQAWLQSQASAAAASASTTDPAKATKDAPFVNSLGMKFVPVPGTNVLFCIHITRRSDYSAYDKAVTGVDASWKTHPKDNNGGPAAQGDDYPVVGVSWDDAKAFCDWLSAKEGRSYRMPADREWSYAVGIGPQEEGEKDATPEKLNGKIKGVYPWGTQWPPPNGAGNFIDTSNVAMFPTWTDDTGKTERVKGIPGYTDGYPLTSPVFAFKPNKLGIHDLAGNIHQWCDGWYDAAQTKRLSRGTPYNAGDKNGMTSSWRTGFKATDRLFWDIGFSGFRCVLELYKP